MPSDEHAAEHTRGKDEIRHNRGVVGINRNSARAKQEDKDGDHEQRQQQICCFAPSLERCENGSQEDTEEAKKQDITADGDDLPSERNDEFVSAVLCPRCRSDNEHR